MVNGVSNPFKLFQDEGGNFGVRTGKEKLKKFIPESPDQGLDNAFGLNSMYKVKRKRGRPKKNQIQGGYF